MKSLEDEVDKLIKKAEIHERLADEEIKKFHRGYLLAKIKLCVVVVVYIISFILAMSSLEYL